MTITNRPYTAADLPILRDFVVAAAGSARWPDYIHAGDLLWWLFQNTVFDPHERVRLWEIDGELVGHAWRIGADELVVQVHPRLRGIGQIEDAMLAWGLAHAATLTQPIPATLNISILADDSVYQQFFGTRGFTRDAARLVTLHQRLDTAPPPKAVPDGFVVRHVAGEAEWDARVTLHREIWHPSKVTLAMYERLRRAPGYIPELDLVAVALDGTFASYCICWLDPVNKRGLFEPVGTRSDFRQRRLGQVVMREGLRRLYALGAREAQVLALADNPAAVRLYESVGFTIIGREYMYERPL